jgi:hypothetical protein
VAILFAASLLFLTGNTAGADDKAIEDLKARLDRLEKQNEELRTKLSDKAPAPLAGPYTPEAMGHQLPVTTADVPQQDNATGLFLNDGNSWPLKSPPAPPPPPAPVPNYPPGATMGGAPGAPQVSDNPGSLQQFIRESLTVTHQGFGTLRLYGFLRGDLDGASNRFADIQNPFFVLPKDANFRTGGNNVSLGSGNDPNYSLYPRLTRMGVDYFGEPIEALGGARVSGRFETDFLTIDPDPNPGVPNVESRQLIRLRLAYVQVQKGGFTFLIGQDWDIIAPLLPTINDNTTMWNAGNLGDRRPIMKILYDWKVSDNTVVQIQNGIYLPDAINNRDLDNNGFRDAEDKVLPGYQGRLGVITQSWVCGEKIIGGVWGAYAESHTNTPIGLSRRTAFNSSVVGCDLRLPIVAGLTFQGELFTGRDLDDLRGGAGQGVNTFLGREVAASGGWCELVARPCTWYQAAVGITTDNPVNGDVVGIPNGVNANGGRTKNGAWYVSNRFFLGKGLTVGADYTSWTTDYLAYQPGHATLCKFFVQQNF